MTQLVLDKLREMLSVKAKNGIDFTLAATILWLLIAYVWTLDFDDHNKSVLTFMIGPLLLPLAFLFSKIFRTVWVIRSNPLQPLGLQLNFAQLFYFPLLVFILIKSPGYFVMGYAIITGAHFYPYAWFYKTKLYAVFAGIIAFGSLILALYVPLDKMFYLPLFTAVCLAVLTLLLFFDSRSKTKKHLLETMPQAA